VGKESTHLQLLQPVLTLGRLALRCLAGFSFAALPADSIAWYRAVPLHMHFSLVIALSALLSKLFRVFWSVSCLDLCGSVSLARELCRSDENER
jgi:hypothetical protein